MEAPPTAIEAEGGRPRHPLRHPLRWHHGADLGLLILRLVLAAAFIGHGAQVMFGAFGGPGLAGFGQFLSVQGFGQSSLLAGLTAITEIGGGILVLFGLFTPVAAAGLLAVVINAVWLKWGSGFFVRPNGAGFELEFVLAGMAAAVVLTGGGRLALDRMFPLFCRPQVTGLPCLVLGVGAAILARVVGHG
ncbi:MAG: putative oxidoreductase [Pseudonocardiales bacterium]|nr:putative oxidoreductase [Pseudonocardiales bacterium]